MGGKNGRFIQFIMDNIATNEASLHGKSSFHTTQPAAWERGPSPPSKLANIQSSHSRGPNNNHEGHTSSKYTRLNLYVSRTQYLKNDFQLLGKTCLQHLEHKQRTWCSTCHNINIQQKPHGHVLISNMQITTHNDIRGESPNNTSITSWPRHPWHTRKLKKNTLSWQSMRSHSQV